jgi:hypothetical protein
LTGKTNYDPIAFKRSSSVLEPIARWLLAMMRYADINTKIEPLRMELRELEESSAIK